MTERPCIMKCSLEVVQTTFVYECCQQRPSKLKVVQAYYTEFLREFRTHTFMNFIIVKDNNKTMILIFRRHASLNCIISFNLSYPTMEISSCKLLWCEYAKKAKQIQKRNLYHHTWCKRRPQFEHSLLFLKIILTKLFKLLLNVNGNGKKS